MSNDITVRLAETEEDRNAVFRFRYDVYVEEMGRYQSVADHGRRMLTEPEDETAEHILALADGEVVGAARGSWGGAGPFSDRQIRQYGMVPFLAEISAEHITVGERAMIRADHRGTDLWLRFMEHASRSADAKNIQVSLGACEPHLLSLYLGLGARTFADHNINSPEAGYLIPIVWVPQDVSYLRSLGSPLADWVSDRGDEAIIPPIVRRLLDEGGAVRSHRLSVGEAFSTEVRRTLTGLGDGTVSAFAGLLDDEVAALLHHSNIIECDAGDLVLKKGGVAHNMFAVLEGVLEVRDGDRVLHVMGAGELFGEMAFLLEQPRSMDVYAATDGTRILSLSDGHLRRLIDREPRATALLLVNLSKMLCYRLITQT
jgi:hypothetical protein